ncbi:hypothetical protein Leryth_002127, partial [Lithospermum erythrorhizon]
WRKEIGAKIRVKVPLKVYHIPKVPEFDLDGKIGTMKQFCWDQNRLTLTQILGNGKYDGPVKFLCPSKKMNPWSMPTEQMQQSQ